MPYDAVSNCHGNLADAILTIRQFAERIRIPTYENVIKKDGILRNNDALSTTAYFSFYGRNPTFSHSTNNSKEANKGLKSIRIYGFLSRINFLL